MAVETIKPYSSDSSKRKQVEAMFDNIASTYDLSNHVLSLGIDKLWRGTAVRTIRRMHPSRISRILDVATGTGDLALRAFKALRPDGIIGCDISEQMMRVGRAKVAEAGLADKIRFVREDCSALSFGDGMFDVVMSAFALRNFANIDTCLKEMHRVLADDGCTVVIDLCAPRAFPMKQVFYIYNRCLMPLAGRLFSHDRKAYSYLPATMAAVRQGREMADLFSRAGFKDVEYKYLAFGMCCMYTGRK